MGMQEGTFRGPWSKDTVRFPGKGGKMYKWRVEESVERRLETVMSKKKTEDKKYTQSRQDYSYVIPFLIN